MNHSQRVSSIRTAWTAGFIFAAFRTLEVLAVIVNRSDVLVALQYSIVNIITAVLVFSLCVLYRRGVRKALLVLPVLMVAILSTNIILEESILRISVDVIMLVIFARGAIAVHQSGKTEQ